MFEESSREPRRVGRKRILLTAAAAKAKRNAEIAAWRKRNPDKVRAYAAARYERDREHILANAKVWKARNRERIAAYEKAYRERTRQNKVAGAAHPLKPLEALSPKYLARLTAAAKKRGITVSELRREGLTQTARGHKVGEARTRQKARANPPA